MKTIKYIFNVIIILVIGITSMCFSCNEQGGPSVPDTPVYPAREDFVRNVGETVVITFKTNMLWEAFLSTPTTEFWFPDGDLKRRHVSGGGGNVTLEINITDVKSLDKDYYCEVSLILGGTEKRVIASITVYADTPYYRVYPAVWDEETAYWKFENDKMVYSSEPQTSVELMFNEEIWNFTRPVKVESNFDWSIPASDVAWIEPVGETDKGVAEVELVAKSSAYPAGGAVDVPLNIMRKNAPEEAAATLKLSMADYRPIYVPMGKLMEDTLVYGNAGNYDAESVDAYTFFAASGIEFCFATKQSYGYDNDVNWLDYELLPANEQTAGNGIYEQNLKIFVRANNGDARTAYLLVKTADRKESGFFSADFQSIAEGVRVYTIEQEAADGILSGPLADILEISGDVSFEPLPKSKNAWLYEEFGCKYAYSLSVSNTDSHIAFNNIPSNYTYEIRSNNNSTGQYSTKQDWWIKYYPASPILVLKLDPASENYWVDPEKDKYYENQMIDPSGTSIKYMGAYLVIKEGNEVLAVVDCKFDSSASSSGEGGLIGFLEAPEGAMINLITIGDLSATLKEAISGSALYDASSYGPISEPLDTNYPVYEIRLPKATVSVTLSVATGALGGYFIPENPVPDWVKASDIEDGQITFSFSDTEAHETAYVFIKGGMCMALISIVKE